MRADVDRVSSKLGRRLKFLVGKPGLDGHSNGAEQIAVRARDAGMDVVYEGIRLTPAEIVEAAREQSAHVVGLSILSGSHVPLVKDVVARMKSAGLDDIPVVVGGIIPPEDAQMLQQAGVAAVYTPKDFELNRIMADIVRHRRTERRQGAVAAAERSAPIATPFGRDSRYAHPRIGRARRRAPIVDWVRRSCARYAVRLREDLCGSKESREHPA